MSMHVPDIAIASNNHGLGLPPGTIFQGTAPAPTNGLVAVAPPPNTAPTRDPSRRVVRGLVPAPAGSLHSLIVREAPRVKVNPADVSKTKAAIRQAERNQSAAETAWAATTTGTNPQGDKDKLLAARDAADVVAKHRARLVELEASAASRPESAAPATPFAVTAAVPVAPEQMLALPHSLPLARTVSPANSGAGLTSTVTGTDWPPESATVMPSVTSASTGFATSSTCEPEALDATGNTAWLLEKAKYGGVPPAAVSVCGAPG